MAALLTISDEAYVDVCAHGVGAKVSGCHKDAASSHKRVINKVTFLYLHRHRGFANLAIPVSMSSLSMHAQYRSDRSDRL